MMRHSQNMRKGLLDLISKIEGENLVMVEIGSYAGESAQMFAESGKFKSVFCVDPWISDPNGDGKNSYKDMDKVEARFDAVAEKFPCIVKCKGTVDTLAEKAKAGEGAFAGLKNGIDFVYIDGLHTYEGVSHDIKTVKAEFPPRIAFSGHDYSGPEHVAGVKVAVDEEFGSPDMTFADTSWLKWSKCAE